MTFEQETRDRQEIIDLTIAYGWLLDHGPRDQLSTVFTQDAVADYGGQVFVGLDAIVDKVEQALGPLTISQHIVSNQQVTVVGDAASCRCYLHAQHHRAGTPGGDNYVIAGRYLDKLIRTNDGWRITQRQLVVDWTEGNIDVVAKASS